MAINKKLGKVAGSITWPNDVASLSASDVGTNRPYLATANTTSEASAAGTGGAVSLSWTQPAGSASALSYTITSSPSTYTVTTSNTSHTFQGLASGVSYTFSVVANNASGSSNAITSSSVTATTVPQAPSGVSASDVGTSRPYNNGAATVSFTAGATGGKAVSTYTATASSGGYSASGSSPITVTGLQSATAYTFTVTATNANGTSIASSASSQITATTVPATPNAPSASSPNAGQDVVSWSAPANGGKSITNYHWESTDSKSGDTGTSTSVTVNQEQGTAQQYRVYATNGNGNSDYSAYSGSVTTTFSFVPFSVFGFSPFGVFGFSPFGVFGFSPFGFSPFGFSPFGFSPFGFSPFGFSPFGFSPFGFVPASKSLFGDTKVRTPNGLVSAESLTVGDEVLSVILPGLPESGWTEADVLAWSLSNPNELDLSNTVVTTITEIVGGTSDLLVFINGDGFSGSHGILVQRDGTALFIRAKDIVETDLVWSLSENSWVNVAILEKYEAEHQVWSVNTEPYDLFFTENMLVHDTRPNMQ
jgi:hypothetical protein